MKIAICDDEKKLRKDLRHLLELHLDLKGIPYEIQEYESGDALLKDEHKEDIQLLFLDIEMPGKGGMETAHGLRDANLKMLIIFVTAYPDYVFQGYEVQAFHYILKPYQETKLRDVLDHCTDRTECSCRTILSYRTKISDTASEPSLCLLLQK